MPARVSASLHNAAPPPAEGPSRSLLLLSPRRDQVELLRRALQPQWEVICVEDAGRAPALASVGQCFAVLVDLGVLRDLAGLPSPKDCSKDAAAEFVDAVDPKDAPSDLKTAMQGLWRQYPGAHTVILAGNDCMREVVATVKQGADNYLTYPIHPDEVRYVLESLDAAKRMEQELAYLRDSFWGGDAARLTQTRSPLMQEVLAKAKAAAPTGALILLTGESGTGKTSLAKLIHAHSTRKDRPFVAVHCGAIPDTLVESELFGHEKGAFTGAIRRKLGKFEIAHGGAIFLDEIGTLSMPAQVKLLQVLQEKTFQRVGGEADIHSDARVIAAANQDLQAMVREGRFREDLYYRLHVFPINIPPLRERKEDIPILLDCFLERLGREYGKTVHGAAPEVLEALARYDWPGNVRELENLIERAFILCQGRMLTLDQFPAEFTPDRDLYAEQAQRAAVAGLSLAEAREQAKDAVEKRYLEDVLALHQGRINKAAAHAGITSRQLHKLMRRHGLDKRDFK